jgi:zinc protease
MISVPYEKHVLSNGLELILHQDRSLPVVAINVWYHVGSKNEKPGRTGFAHLFEHVMFEGSKHHNRSYFEPLQKIGANLNGSTNPDRTNYWENVPSNYLELALWLESDRMGFLLDALDQQRFDVQRDVVKNERRQSYENRPYGMAYLLLQPEVFPLPHPYNWPTIGSQEDLDSAKLEDIKGFFRTFYSPSNASIAIAGDIEPDQALNLVEKYFGDLKPAAPIAKMKPVESSLSGTKVLTMEDDVQLERRYVVWPGPPAFDEWEPALDVLATVLADGKGSRLHRRLVHDTEMARDVAAFAYSQEISGEFFVQVTTSKGEETARVSEVVEQELAAIKKSPPTEAEMERAGNQIETHFVSNLERTGGFGGRADQLNYFSVLAGDPGMVTTYPDRYKAVTADQVSAAASRFLGDTRVELTVTPKETAGE